MTPPPYPPLPGGGIPHPAEPRLVLDATAHARLVTHTPEHIARDRWMTSVQHDAAGSHIHVGTPDHADQITAWLARPAGPLAVGTVARLDSRLTLTRHADGVRVEIAYLAGGHLSVGAVALSRPLADQWAGWLRGWLTAHPAPVGQIALFAHLSAAAAA